MLFRRPELLPCAHVCMLCLAQSWGGVHQFYLSIVCYHVGYTVPVARVPCCLHACQQLVWMAFCARTDWWNVCRAIRLVNFPRDGHAPSDCASGSDAFPPKSSGAARSGIDEAMGPWLCPQEGDVLLLAHLTVHMDPECLLIISRRTYPLRMCYCVTKLHRCFHYDVDSDFVLHSNCRCSENVDVATDKYWPVVTMCRLCSPFPERQDDGNSSAHWRLMTCALRQNQLSSSRRARWVGLATCRHDRLLRLSPAMECTSMRPCASSKGYDELQTLISVQKSAGEMPHFEVMHLSSKILHSQEGCPLPSLRTCSSQLCYCVWSVVMMGRRCSLFPERLVNGTSRVHADGWWLLPCAKLTECLAVRNACCTGCCLGRLIVVLLHYESLQLARLEKSRPDELIWLHAYMTGRVHALMPATHLQMSGRSMHGHTVQCAGGCCECLQWTEYTSKRPRYGILDPYLWSHMQYMWATGLSSDDSPWWSRVLCLWAASLAPAAKASGVWEWILWLMLVSLIRERVLVGLILSSPFCRRLSAS